MERTRKPFAVADHCHTRQLSSLTARLATAISLVLLLVHVVYLLFVRWKTPDSQNGDLLDPADGSTTIEHLGGGKTVVLKAIRLSSCLFLLCSTALLVSNRAFSWETDVRIQFGLCATYVRTVSSICGIYPHSCLQLRDTHYFYRSYPSLTNPQASAQNSQAAMSRSFSSSHGPYFYTATSGPSPPSPSAPRTPPSGPSSGHTSPR